MTRIIIDLEDTYASKLKELALADERPLSVYCRHRLRDLALKHGAIAKPVQSPEPVKPTIQPIKKGSSYEEYMKQCDEAGGKTTKNHTEEF